VANARAARTRIVAPNVFVRGRRWAMERRNSSEWRFFCMGQERKKEDSDSDPHRDVTRCCPQGVKGGLRVNP